MRGPLLGACASVAACTLLVPIDDDLTASATDGSDAGGEAATIDRTDGAANGDAADAGEPYDSGERFGPPRDGCPNGVSLDTSLEAYYPFDETEGTVLHDCSHKAHDLNAVGDVPPKWSEGHIRGAGDFDGNDGCFASGDSNLNKFEEQPFSISVWVSARQFFEASKTGRWIVSHKASPKGWHVGMDDPAKFELDLEWTSDVGPEKTQINVEAPLTTWTHYVATYSNAGEAAVYKNGVLATKVSGPDKVPAAFGTGTNVFFRIGCRGPGSGVFDGRLDELRIYPRVISEELIKKLAEAR